MKARTLAGIAAAAAVLGFGLAASAADNCEGPPSDTKLTVEVSGVTPPIGEVATTLYPDDPSRFLARGSGAKLALQRVKAGTTATSCFWLPGPGFYAVAIYHDANSDHKFNRTVIGLPAEGFGFSNDAPAKVGLPAFADTRFRANVGETTIHIRMRYLR